MITITYDPKHHDGFGYNYFVSNSTTSICAFVTEEQFHAWINLMEIPMEIIEDKEDFKIWKTQKTLNDCFFHKTNELPSDAKPFLGLCNGSYVKCYVQTRHDCTTVFRPNPNSKEVYQPFDYQASRIQCEKGDLLNLDLPQERGILRRTAS